MRKWSVVCVDALVVKCSTAALSVDKGCGEAHRVQGVGDKCKRCGTVFGKFTGPIVLDVRRKPVDSEGMQNDRIVV